MQHHDVNPSARPAIAPVDAIDVIDFWVDAGHALCFAKNTEFDRRFRERFLPLHEAAARGELGYWLRSASGSLALLLLLDQFPRNAFRGTPRMYETDALARESAHQSIEARHDTKVPEDLRLFFYLPFARSEHLADQERCVLFSRRLGQPHLAHAERHRDIVRRFGRFHIAIPSWAERRRSMNSSFSTPAVLAGRRLGLVPSSPRSRTRSRRLQ
jgi:uncharacterized protein (DUF924 family)